MLDRDERRPLRNPNIPWRDDDILGKPGVLIGRYGVNFTGAKIWRLCDGEHSVDEIVTIISSEFKTDKKRVEADVIEFLKKLEELKLILWK